jgi:hypothetical protein
MDAGAYTNTEKAIRHSQETRNKNKIEHKRETGLKYGVDSSSPALTYTMKKKLYKAMFLYFLEIMRNETAEVARLRNFLFNN